MRRCCLFAKHNSVIVVLACLCTIAAVPVNAQPADSQHAVMAGYDKAHEITLNGTIEKVITEPAAGSPFGLHLMVAGADGAVDAHLGPYMTREVREALQAGTPVQIVGAMGTFGGKSYLMARQVIFSGRLVTVRSENGFLVVGHAPHGHRAQAKTSEVKPGEVRPDEGKADGGAR